MSPKRRGARRRWPVECLGFSAGSERELVARLTQVRAWLAATSDGELADVARTLAANAQPAPSRLSIVAANAAEACTRIDSALERMSGGRQINDPRGLYRFDARLDGGTVAFLFPGDGAQYRGMLLDLCLEFPEVRAWFDLIDRASPDGPLPPSRLIRPSDQADGDEQGQELYDAAGSTQLVFAACQGMRHLLEQLGIQPHAVVGHCAGDHSAHLAAGTLRLTDEPTLVAFIRGIDATLDSVPNGAVFAVPAAALPYVNEARQRLEAGALFVTLDNCAQQLVVWCSADVDARVLDALRGAGVNPVALPFRRALHTALAGTAACRLLELFETVEICPAKIPLYSCVSAQRYPSDPAEIRRLAASVWCEPMRFRETVRAMYDAGCRIFVEVGPRGNLTGFVKSILEGRPHLAVATDVPSRPGLVQLQHAVAQLFAAGVPLTPDRLYTHRGAELVDFDAPARPRVATAGSSVRLNARLPRLSAGVDLPVAGDMRAEPSGVVPQASDPRAAAMDVYFKTIARLIDVEREVTIEALKPAKQPSRPLSADLPFVREIVSFSSGARVTVRCTLDLEEDLFLRDHTLGCGGDRANGDRPGLAIVPMTVGMEMLAEVATLLIPGKPVVEIADVEMSRWIGLERDTITLELAAERHDADSVVVELREVGAGHVLPSLRGRVTLRDTRPPRPSPRDLVLHEIKRSVATDPATIYADPRMFHGPVFQSLQFASESGTNGIVGQLLQPSAARFFATRNGDRLLVQPSLLDGMGQLIGCWLFDHFELESVFPLRVARLQWFQPVIPAGSPVTCRVHVQLLRDRWLESNLELIDARGDLIAAIDGWTNRRVRVPPRLYTFMGDPGRACLSVPHAVESSAASSDGTVSATVALDDLSAELSDGGMIWLRMVAHASLTPAERARWYGIPEAPDVRAQWLAERVAAKDAVRALTRATGRRELHPAQISLDGETSPFAAAWDGCERRPSIVVERQGGSLIATATCGCD